MGTGPKGRCGLKQTNKGKRMHSLQDQPFNASVMQLRTRAVSVAHPLDGLGHDLAVEVDHLDPLACDRASLEGLIDRTAGEPRAFLLGVLEMRERIAYITGCPF